MYTTIFGTYLAHLAKLSYLRQPGSCKVIPRYIKFPFKRAAVDLEQSQVGCFHADELLVSLKLVRVVLVKLRVEYVYWT